MSLSVWDYVRRRTCEAMLAGFQDALDYLERQDQAQLMHAAAKNFRKRMHELPHNGANGNGNGNHSDGAGAGSTSTAGQPSAKPKPPAPQHSQQQQLPDLLGPEDQAVAAQHASSAPSPQSQPRGPGRPRKEVHG
jgi:hypothetical protein